MMSPHISTAFAFERQSRHRHEALEHRRAREATRVRVERDPAPRRARTAERPAAAGAPTGRPSPAH